MNEALQYALTADAYAEAAEFDTGDQLVAPVEKQRKKKVVMGIDSPRLPLTAIRHALSLCERVGAVLEILHIRPHVQSRHEAAANRSAAKMLVEMGGNYCPIAGPGPGRLEEELLQQTAARSDIMLVLLQSVAPKVNGRGGLVKRLAEKIHCPVVVVKEKA